MNKEKFKSLATLHIKTELFNSEKMKIEEVSIIELKQNQCKISWNMLVTNVHDVELIPSFFIC